MVKFLVKLYQNNTENRTRDVLSGRQKNYILQPSKLDTLQRQSLLREAYSANTSWCEQMCKNPLYYVNLIHSSLATTLGHSYICFFLDFNVNLMNHCFFSSSSHFYSSTDPLAVLPDNCLYGHAVRKLQELIHIKRDTIKYICICVLYLYI